MYVYTDSESDANGREPVLPNSDKPTPRKSPKQKTVSGVAEGSEKLPRTTTTEPPADGEEFHTIKSVSPKKGRGNKRRRMEGKVIIKY